MRLARSRLPRLWLWQPAPRTSCWWAIPCSFPNRSRVLILERVDFLLLSTFSPATIPFPQTAAFSYRYPAGCIPTSADLSLTLFTMDGYRAIRRLLDRRSLAFPHTIRLELM